MVLEGNQHLPKIVTPLITGAESPSDTRQPFAREPYTVVAVGDVDPSVRGVDSHLVALGPAHKRTLTNEVVNDQAVWGGKFPCDVFGAGDKKGARMDRVFLRKDPFSESGWRVEGLLGEDEAQLARTASTAMRKGGLPTEAITRVTKLSEIVLDDGTGVTVSQWKKGVLQEMQQKLDQAKHDGESEAAERLEDELRTAQDFLTTFRPVIADRELQVAERLIDFGNATTKAEFDQVANPVMNWINNATRAKKCGILPGTPIPEPFTTQPTAIRRFFGEWLPDHMGRYLGRLHKEGMVGGFASAHNWSGAATLYDTGSMSGKPVGDPPITDNGIAIDTRKSIGALKQILQPETRENYLLTNFPNLERTALPTFAASYVLERYGPQISEAELDQVRRKLFGTELIGRIEYPGLDDDLWNEVKKKL